MSNFKFTDQEREKIYFYILDRIPETPYQSAAPIDVIDTVEQIVNERDGWISVEDRTPKNQTCVIAFDGETVFQAYYDDYYEDEPAWQTMELNPIDKEVTHWQPIPNPPKSKT